MRHVSKRGAFTLIELLVVITIIVVLLALLVPALDKAVYQAQLAVCGSRLKSLATAATTYAAASRVPGATGWTFFPTRASADNRDIRQ